MVTKVNRPSLISGSFRNNKKIIIQTELLFDLVGISAPKSRLFNIGIKWEDWF